MEGRQSRDAQGAESRGALLRLDAYTIGWALVILFAVFTRLWDLGRMALHHDESIHAYYSLQLLLGKGYKYDPVYHGPFLYHANALIHALFGVSDYTCRLLPALFGIGLVLLAMPLQRYFGKVGALATGAFISMSPCMTYFSRFIRDDMYIAFYTLGMVLCFLYYVETRKPRYLYWLSALLSLSFCTMENTFLTVFIYLSFLFFLVFGKVLVRYVYLFPPWRRGSVGLAQSVLVWGGTAAAVLCFLQWNQQFMEWVARQIHLFLGIVVVAGVLALLGLLALLRKDEEGAPKLAAFIDYLKQSWPQLAIAMGIFWAIYIPLFTTFFTNPPGLWRGITGIYYWLTLHNKPRIPGPWYYYVPLLIVYELPILLLGLRGLRQAAAKKKPFFAFLIWWLATSFALYAYAQEKVPWLMVHVALPLCLLAGFYVGEAFEYYRERAGKVRRAVAIGVLAVLALFSLRTNIIVTFLNPDDPREMMIFVQSHKDVKRMMQVIEDVSFKLGTKENTPITISGDANWPFSWYLRDYTASYPSRVTSADSAVVIVDWTAPNETKVNLERTYTGQKYHLRGWWIPSIPRLPARPSNWIPDWIERQLPDFGKVGLKAFWKYFLYRETYTPIGTFDVIMYIRNDILRGTYGGIVTEEIRKEPRSQVRQENPQVIIGRLGSGQGEFNEPRGIAVSASGQVYVVDCKNCRIQQFTADGQFVRSWGNRGTGEGDFQEPCGIDVDLRGDVLVADTWNHRVQKFTAEGRFIKAWGGEGNGNSQFFGPRDITHDAENNYYVTDTGNRRIQKFRETGQFVRMIGFGGRGDGQLTEPVGLDVDRDRRELYIADTGNKRIQVFDLDGTFLRKWEIYGWEEFYTEPYLSLSRDGRLLFTDSRHDRLQIWTTRGEFTGFWGKKGNQPGSFDLPIGVEVDPSGNVWVADTFNHRIQKFGPVQ